MSTSYAAEALQNQEQQQAQQQEELTIGQRATLAGMAVQDAVKEQVVDRIGDAASYLGHAMVTHRRRLAVGAATGVTALGVPAAFATTAKDNARMERLDDGCQERVLIGFGAHKVAHRRHNGLISARAVRLSVTDASQGVPLENGQLIQGDFQYRLFRGAKICGAVAKYEYEIPGSGGKKFKTVWKFPKPSHHTPTSGDYKIEGVADNSSIYQMAIYATPGKTTRK